MIPEQGFQIIDMTRLRVCRTCGFEKPIAEFHENRSSRDGLDHRCKPCNNDHHRIRSMVRRRTDPFFRLQENIRSAVYNSLKGRGKSKRTLEIIGLESWDQLRDHLNDNPYGYIFGDKDLDIDHRRPLSWYENPEDAWHYTNLQLANSDWNRYTKRDRFEA